MYTYSVKRTLPAQNVTEYSELFNKLRRVGLGILLQFGFDVCLFVRLLLGRLWTDRDQLYWQDPRGGQQT